MFFYTKFGCTLVRRCRYCILTFGFIRTNQSDRLYWIYYIILISFDSVYETGTKMLIIWKYGDAVDLLGICLDQPQILYNYYALIW